MWRGSLVAAALAAAVGPGAATGLRSGVDALGRRIHHLRAEVQQLQGRSSPDQWSWVDAEMTRIHREVQRSRAKAVLLADPPATHAGDDTKDEGAGLQDTQAEMKEVLAKLDEQQSEITQLASMVKALHLQAPVNNAHVFQTHLPAGNPSEQVPLLKRRGGSTDGAVQPETFSDSPASEENEDGAAPRTPPRAQIAKKFEATSAAASMAIEAAKQTVDQRAAGADDDDDDDDERLVDPGPPEESTFELHPMLQRMMAQSQADDDLDVDSTQSLMAHVPASSVPQGDASAPDAETSNTTGDSTAAFDNAERLLKEDSPQPKDLHAKAHVSIHPAPDAPRALIGDTPSSGETRTPWWYEAEHGDAPWFLNKAGGYHAHRAKNGKAVPHGRYSPVPEGYVPTLPPRRPRAPVASWPDFRSQDTAPALAYGGAVPQVPPPPSAVQPPPLLANPAQPPKEPKQAEPAQQEPVPEPEQEPEQEPVPDAEAAEMDAPPPPIASDFFAPPPPGMVAQAPA